MLSNNKLNRNKGHEVTIWILIRMLKMEVSIKIIT